MFNKRNANTVALHCSAKQVYQQAQQSKQAFMCQCLGVGLQGQLLLLDLACLGVGPQGQLLLKDIKYQAVDLWASMWASRYDAGVGGGRPIGRAQKQDERLDKAEPAAVTMSEDAEWCSDEKMVNVSAAKLKRLENLIAKNSKLHHLGRQCAGGVREYSVPLLALAAHILSLLPRE